MGVLLHSFKEGLSKCNINMPPFNFNYIGRRYSLWSLAIQTLQSRDFNKELVRFKKKNLFANKILV